MLETVPPIFPHRKTREEPPLLFGLPSGGSPDDQLIHISRVLNGKACACLCPKCRDPLIARQGDRLLHHFAHESGYACSGAAETALHRIAKQCLSGGAEFLVPE